MFCMGLIRWLWKELMLAFWNGQPITISHRLLLWRRISWTRDWRWNIFWKMVRVLGQMLAIHIASIDENPILSRVKPAWVVCLHRIYTITLSLRLLINCFLVYNVSRRITKTSVCPRNPLLCGVHHQIPYTKLQNKHLLTKTILETSSPKIGTWRISKRMK